MCSLAELAVQAWLNCRVMVVGDIRRTTLVVYVLVWMQAGVLSLLTAVLLNAAPSCTPAEASSKALPPNFVEAAHLVMSVLNNVCCLDLQAAQHMLSCTHNRLEFFHLISFLLSYCSSRWPAPAPGPVAANAARPAHWEKTQQEQTAMVALSISDGDSLHHCKQPGLHPQGASAGHVANHPCLASEVLNSATLRKCDAAASSNSAELVDTDSSSRAQSSTEQQPRARNAALMHHPIAELLNQVMLLVGYFCVLHPSNQAMLQWGRSPSILQRLCSLPEQYLTVPELRAVAMPTLLAVCFQGDRACDIVAQHFSLQSLLLYLQQESQLVESPGRLQCEQERSSGCGGGAQPRHSW